MPDNEKTIDVHYRADHVPKVWFSPDDGNVEMTQSGKITFRKADDSSEFSFTGITISPASTDFSVDTLQDHKLTLRDADATAGTYSYCINLDTASGPVSSDPQIINKPE